MTNFKRLMTGALLLLLHSSGAQDIHFSQFTFSGLGLNPALTAADHDINATVQYKEQWKSLQGFRTAAACFEMKPGRSNWDKVKNKTATFSKKKPEGLAFGLHLFSDKAGDGHFRQVQADLGMAYHLLLDPKNILSGGIAGGFSQKSIVPDELRFNNQYSGGVFDPAAMQGENFSRQSFAYADYSAGLLFTHNNGARYMRSGDQRFFNLGCSASHVSRPPQSFYTQGGDRLYMKLTAHGDALFGIKGTGFSAGPSFLFMQQGPLREWTAGATLKYQLAENSKYTGYVKGASIAAGCYYRNKDAVIPFFLFEIGSCAIGASYDATVSTLAAANRGRGGMEIMLRFNSPNPFLNQNVSKF